MTQYAPHPGAMASDIWPVSMSEMTDQLKQTRNQRSPSKPPSSAIVGTSPYDNRAEAAAGAAALVKNQQQRPYPARNATEPASGRSKYSRMSMPQPFRSASLPTADDGPVPNGSHKANGSAQPASPAVNTSLAHSRAVFNGGPQRLPPSPNSPDLPFVVLTPPDDEHDGPDIALFPHPAPGAAEFADGGNVKKILDAPMPPPRDAMPPGEPPEEPQEPRQRTVHPYAQAAQQQQSTQPHHPYHQQQQQQRRVTANGHGNAVPAGAKKRDPVINNATGNSAASGSTSSLVERRVRPSQQRVPESQFDNEWASLVESLPSPAPQPGADDDGPVPPRQTPPPTPPLPMGQQRRNGSKENVSSNGGPLYASRRAPSAPGPEGSSSSRSRSPHVDKRSASAPNGPATPRKDGVQKEAAPSDPSTPKHKKSMESQEATTKPQRRRILSLSSLFSRKKKPNFEDLPPMPAGEQQVPKSPKSPKTPKRPKSPKAPKGKEFPSYNEDSVRSENRPTTPNTKRERRKTLKEVFGMGGFDSKSVRKSKSKPDLRHRNSFEFEPVPPLPAVGRAGSPVPGARSGSPVPTSAAWPGGAPAPVAKTAVPEALAALTANASKDKPKVEVVPDVFAAFNSSSTSLINTSTVRRQTMKSPTGEEPIRSSPLRESSEDIPPVPAVTQSSGDKKLPMPPVTRRSDENQHRAPSVTRRSDEKQHPASVTRRSDERKRQNASVTRRSDERNHPSATVSRSSNEKPPQPSFVVKGGAHTGGARMPNTAEEEDFAARQRHAEALAALEGHGKKGKKERKAAEAEAKKEKGGRSRSQSLSKRISMSVIGVFKRKKDDGGPDDDELPDVPALPAAYVKHSTSSPNLHNRAASPMGIQTPDSTWGRATGAQIIQQLGGRSPDSTWGRSTGPPVSSVMQHAGASSSTTSLNKREKRMHNIQRIPPPRLKDDERLASDTGHSSDRSQSPASVDVPNVTLPLKIRKQPSISEKPMKPVVVARSPGGVASPTSVSGVSAPSEGIIHNGHAYSQLNGKKDGPKEHVSAGSQVATEPPRVASPALGSPSLGFDPMSPKGNAYKRLSKGMPAALAASATRKRSVDGLPQSQNPEVTAQFRQLVQSPSPPTTISELPTEGALSLSGLQTNNESSPTVSSASESTHHSAVTPVFTTSPSFPPQLAPLQIQQSPLTPSRDATPTPPATLRTPSATPDRHGELGEGGEPLSPNTSLHSPGNSIHNIEVEVVTATRQSMIRSTSQPVLAAVAAGSVVSLASSGGSTLSRVGTNEEATNESDTSTPTPSGLSSNDESPFFQRSTTSVDRIFPGGPPKYSSAVPEEEEDEQRVDGKATAAHEAKKPVSSNHVSHFSMDSTASRDSKVSVDSVYSQRDSRMSKDFNFEAIMPRPSPRVTTDQSKSRHVSNFSVDSAMSTAALIAENDMSDSDSVASTPTKPSPTHGPLTVHPVEMALADTSEVLITPVDSDGGDIEELAGNSKPSSLSSRAASPSPSVASSVLLPSVNPNTVSQPTATTTASSLFAMVSNSVSQASQSVANAVTAVLGSDQTHNSAREGSASSHDGAAPVPARAALPEVPGAKEDRAERIEKQLPAFPQRTESPEKALPPWPSMSERSREEKALPASPSKSERDGSQSHSDSGAWESLIQSSESTDSVASKTSYDIPETPTTTTSNSVYATPTSEMSPERSTTSLYGGSVTAYDSDDGVTRSLSQRRGSMPAALRATAIRRRTSSQPITSVVMGNNEPPNRLEFGSPVPPSQSPVLGRPVVLRSTSMPVDHITQSPRALTADLTGPASVASSLPWLSKTPAVAELEEILESTSSTPTPTDTASEAATIKGSVTEDSPVPPTATMFPDAKSSSGCNGGMTSPELSVESRVDSPLGFSLCGDSEDATHAVDAPPNLDSFVVPFPPDAEHAPLGAMPRSPTVPANYTATASARERTRRDSGQNMKTAGGYPVPRRILTSSSDTSVNVIPSGPAKQARQSLQALPDTIEMDFSARSSMGPTGPEFSLWLESTANSAPIEELEELTRSPGFQAAKYRHSRDEPMRLVYDSPGSSISTASTSRPMMRRPLPNPEDFRNGSVSSPVRENAYETSSLHSSSGSDDGPALCTPRTPDTAHLVSDFEVTPSKKIIMAGSSGGKAEQISRGLPNRPMHVDMGGASGEEDESFATAREGME